MYCEQFLLGKSINKIGNNSKKKKCNTTDNKVTDAIEMERLHESFGNNFVVD